ncbi:hypothetical protein SAMN05446037_1006131 [Anaerovirgula multivorans]|uniref:Uncharacterized protein n=1 Tax=Anaerovirgula multivorans TaxID=312168 RepID=A0A239CSQ9_9FIRM|nr:hypothetical protein [Anaerovirgula multivorans]SNS23117.1 hypothetical protein SAMN05446037_1006131 [Anaerovirgula multivorans]
MRKQLLKDLLQISSVSGKEELVVPVILDELESLGFTAHQDAIGNVFATRGKGPYPLLNAHMDIVDIQGYGWFYGQNDNIYDASYYENLMSYGLTCGDCVNYNYCKLLNPLLCEHFEVTGEAAYILEIAELDYLMPEDVDMADNFCITESYGVLTGSGERVLGGDDKCGIFIALELARLLPRQPFKILFTVQEEEGCVGVRHAVKNKKWFKDILYALVIDRKGGDNLLWSQLGSKSCSNNFASQLAMRGVDAGISVQVMDGSISDTMYLKNVVPEAVNVSAGYHDAHTEKEYVVLSEVAGIINWLSHFIRNYHDIKTLYKPVVQYKAPKKKKSKKLCKRKGAV